MLKVAAISLSKNPVLHESSKHIDTKYHFIRNYVEDGISIEFVSTKDQISDILTKPLARVKFQELRSKIGVIEINERQQN